MTDADLIPILHGMRARVECPADVAALTDAADAIERLAGEVKRLKDELAQLQSLAAARADDDARENAVLMAERATLKAAHEQDIGRWRTLFNAQNRALAAVEAHERQLVERVNQHEQEVEAAYRDGYDNGWGDSSAVERGIDDIGVDEALGRFRASRAAQKKEQDHE